MKLFKSGDVLFARRNAYLKRTSQVYFDGICSGDAIVIRENQKKIVNGFLTILMNTDRFWEYAIANAAGTMSKRVKWRDLANYKFKLPSIKEQIKYIDIFNHIQKTIESFNKQIFSLKTLKQNLLNEILG